MTDTLIAGDDLYINWDDAPVGEAVTNYTVTVRPFGGGTAIYSAATNSVMTEKTIPGATTASWLTGSYEITVVAINSVGTSAEMTVIPLDVNGSGVALALNATSAPIADAGNTTAYAVAYTWAAATGQDTYQPYIFGDNLIPDKLPTALNTDSSLGWRLAEQNKYNGWLGLPGDGSMTYTPDGLYGNRIYTHAPTDGALGVCRISLTITAGSLTATTGWAAARIVSVAMTASAVYEFVSDLVLVAPDGTGVSTLGLEPSVDADFTINSITYHELTASGSPVVPAEFVYTTTPEQTVRMAYKAIAGAASTELSDSGVNTSLAAATTPPGEVYGNADSASIVFDTATQIDVLANDTYNNVDHITLPLVVKPASVSVPAHGTATIHASGTILYTPTSGYSGSDTFTYVPQDSTGTPIEGGTTTVTVTVQALVRTVTLAAITPPSVLAGDTYTDTLTATHSNNDDITWSIECVGIPAASIFYTAGHPADKTPTLHIPTDITLALGTYEAIVTAADAYQNSDSEAITITVSGVTAIEAPIAGNISVDVVAGATDTPIDILSVCSDPASLTLEIYTVGGVSCRSEETVYTQNGTITNTNDVLYYTQNTGFWGVEYINYIVTNGVKQSSQGLITVNVSRDIFSEGTDITYIVEPSSGTGFSQTGNLATELGITSASGSTITYEVTLQPTEGSFSIDSSGNYTFTFGSGSSLTLRRI